MASLVSGTATRRSVSVRTARSALNSRPRYGSWPTPRTAGTSSHAGSVSRTGQEWADRVAANRSVAYRIHLDVERGRWYVTASWQISVSRTVSLQAALAQGVIGVDMNADHLAAWRLDAHGNPTGRPRRFAFDLSGPTDHRDAQVRHALTRLLHWARTCGVKAIAVEDLDFTTEKTREKHGASAASAVDLRYAHPQAPRPADLHGRPDRHRDHRRGPGLHQPLGRPALAEAPHRHHAQDDPPRRCRRGDRTTRPGTPDPATDDTAPTRPE
jgi:hypothetical protein